MIGDPTSDHSVRIEDTDVSTDNAGDSKWNNRLHSDEFRSTLCLRWSPVKEKYGFRIFSTSSGSLGGRLNTVCVQTKSNLSYLSTSTYLFIILTISNLLQFGRFLLDNCRRS